MPTVAIELHQYSPLQIDLASRSKLGKRFTKAQYPFHKASSSGSCFHLTSTSVTAFPSLFTILLSRMSPGSKFAQQSLWVPSVVHALCFSVSASAEKHGTHGGFWHQGAVPSCRPQGWSSVALCRGHRKEGRASEAFILPQWSACTVAVSDTPSPLHWIPPQFCDCLQASSFFPEPSLGCPSRAAMRCLFQPIHLLLLVA